MKKFFLIAACCVFCHCLTAQSALDTLKNSLSKIPKQPHSFTKDSLIVNRLSYRIYFVKDKNQREIHEDSMRNVAQKWKWNKAMPYYYHQIGYLNIVENNLYSAFNNLEKALIGFSKLKVNVLNKVLYQSYKGVNQPAKAFQYLEKVKLYEENSEAKKLNENYTEWQLKYEDEKQKTQIKTLENEKLKRANERQDLFRNVLIVSVLMGLFITIYVFQNNKKLRLKNQELRQKNNEILGAMSKGQTIERKRVASELHDNLNTKLVALKWRIEALDISNYPSEDQKILTDFTRVLDDIYMDVRFISHNLHPAELETMGLIAALQKLMNNLSNQRITFHFLTEGIEQRFNPIFENELYNITLELINNILKHSQASQAWVSLTMQDDKISLTVSDNGKGIDLSRLADGVGLRNVHSRVENLNGKIQITNGRHSNENANGTNVQVDLTV